MVKSRFCTYKNNQYVSNYDEHLNIIINKENKNTFWDIYRRCTENNINKLNEWFSSSIIDKYVNNVCSDWLTGGAAESWAHSSVDNNNNTIFCYSTTISAVYHGKYTLHKLL